MSESIRVDARHITNLNELLLSKKAEELSQQLDGTDIVIIAAGKSGTRFDRCTTGSTLFLSTGWRFRDFLGIVETAKQIETLKHFPGRFKQQLQTVEEESQQEDAPDQK
jgi:hypothetical protein